MSSNIVAWLLGLVLVTLVYFSVSINTVFIWITIGSIATYVGLQVYRSYNPDVTSTYSDNKTVAFIEMSVLVILVLLSVLFFLKGVA